MIEALQRKQIGQGAFGTVYKYTGHLPIAMVVEGGENADSDPEKFVYLKECMRRLRKYGLHSPEMAMLPEVLEVGRNSDGKRYALVRRYPFTAYERRWDFSRTKCERSFTSLHPEFGFPGDGHAGNWMRCPIRKQWIMIDPQFDPQFAELDPGWYEGRIGQKFNKTQPKPYSKKAKPRYH